MNVSWSKGVESVRDLWLRPVEGGDIIADSRQRESKAGVAAVSALTVGGGQRAAHSSLTSTAKQQPHSQHFTSFCLESTFWRSVRFCLWFPGGRRTQVPPRVLCVSELQGGDWGQGYLRFSRTIQTLLVSHLHCSVLKLYATWTSEGVGNTCSWQLLLRLNIHLIFMLII